MKSMYLFGAATALCSSLALAQSAANWSVESKPNEVKTFHVMTCVVDIKDQAGNVIGQRDKGIRGMFKECSRGTMKDDETGKSYVPRDIWNDISVESKEGVPKSAFGNPIDDQGCTKALSDAVKQTFSEMQSDPAMQKDPAASQFLAKVGGFNHVIVDFYDNSGRAPDVEAAIWHIPAKRVKEVRDAYDVARKYGRMFTFGSSIMITGGLNSSGDCLPHAADVRQAILAWKDSSLNSASISSTISNGFAWLSGQQEKSMLSQRMPTDAKWKAPAGLNLGPAITSDSGAKQGI